MSAMKKQTIFDIYDPFVYRFVHVCQSCKQLNFFAEDDRHACRVCGEADFLTLPYFDPSRDYGLDVDKYAINMMYALYKKGLHRTEVVFDDFYRKAPFVRPVGDQPGELGGYVVFGGLEHLIDIVDHLYVTEDDIAYLMEQEENYEQGFLDELRRLRFTGDLCAMQEGQLCFPNTPYIRIKAPILECIWIEAQLLNTINSESLFMTKGSRIHTAAGGSAVIEMGKRRAQGRDASVQGARAAYVTGFTSTSNMKAGKLYGVPAKGTHAHLYVQFYPSELEAFLDFANVFPASSILLVDTFDVLESGIPHAIEVAKRMEQKGRRLLGIRLDSGDLAYLSKRARTMLDEAGLTYVKIVASSDLDENTILSLQNQGAKIDMWGIGTKFITAHDSPALGGVHKLVARKMADHWQALIKISENINKIINPGYKKVYRLYGADGMAKGDYICLEHEHLDAVSEIELKHPSNPLKKKRVKNFQAVELLHPIFKNGQLVYQLPSLHELREFHLHQKQTFWEEYLRLDNPEVYPVALSDELIELKDRLLAEKRGRTS